MTRSPVTGGGTSVQLTGSALTPQAGRCQSRDGWVSCTAPEPVLGYVLIWGGIRKRLPVGLLAFSTGTVIKLGRHGASRKRTDSRAVPGPTACGPVRAAPSALRERRATIFERPAGGGGTWIAAGPWQRPRSSRRSVRRHFTTAGRWFSPNVAGFAYVVLGRGERPGWGGGSDDSRRQACSPTRILRSQRDLEGTIRPTS